MNIVFLRRKNLGKRTGNNKFRSSFPIIEVKNWKNNYNDYVPADILIRWGCLSKYPQNQGCKVINKADAIRTVSDKGQFRIDMQDANIPTPLTYFDYEKAFNENPGIKRWVIRPSYHNKGKEFNLVDKIEDAQKVCENIGDYYISEWLDIDKEFRVEMVGNKISLFTDKTNIKNIEDIPFEEMPGYMTMLAYQVKIVSGLDMIGIDFAQTKDKLYVLEANSAPSHKNKYRLKNFWNALDILISDKINKFYSKS